MILTKNKLKRIKKPIDDDMLNYLKYSHLDFFDKNKDKSFENKATQFPETMNKSTQTKDTADKGVDTYDDLNVVVGDYDLYGNHSNINKNDKMVQVNTRKTNSPPSSSSSDGGEGFVSRNVRRGFRLAEFALNTAITGANISMAVGDTIADSVFTPQAEVEEHQQEQQEQQEVISVHSSPAQTINSSSSRSSGGLSTPTSVVEISSSSSRHTPTSIPAPSSPASSAKTTPRKKSK